MVEKIPSASLVPLIGERPHVAESRLAGLGSIDAEGCHSSDSAPNSVGHLIADLAIRVTSPKSLLGIHIG
jgi:hypothetical protein